MKRLAAFTALLLVALLAVPASAQQTRPAAVSLTFDSGHRSQMPAARLLRSHNMPGTFYLNSGYMTYDAYVGQPEVRSLARMGHEIAGASRYHRHLVDMPRARAKAEVCTDRQRLSQVSGVPVTSFAYPYGEVSESLTELVKECGYNSARGVHGLYVATNSCSSCPHSEPDPPKDRYYLRTSTAVGAATSLEDLKGRVEAAEREGGWVPLVFRRFCTSACKDDELSLDRFDAFLAWLGNRPATQVLTVDEVLGGETQPQNAGTDAAPLGADPLTTRGSLANAAAFDVHGYGVGQSQVVMAFTALGVVSVLAYRWSTKKKRYVMRRVTP